MYFKSSFSCTFYLICLADCVGSSHGCIISTLFVVKIACVFLHYFLVIFHCSMDNNHELTSGLYSVEFSSSELYHLA